MNSERPKRPNVLFILADQHNTKVLGHAGHPNVKTPNLDRMVAEGVRFSNAVCQNPICTPSRMCYLSGQYAHNHGYYGLEGGQPNGLPTVLGHFRRVGYRTSAIGKIHCPEYWVEDDSDVFHETCGCSIGGRSKDYEAFLRQRGKIGLEDHNLLTEFGETGRQTMEGRPSPLAFDESQEGWITAQTIAFMKQCADEGRPFFAHASLPRPHQCTSPSEPFWSLYEGVDLALPPNADYDLEGGVQAPHLIRTARQWREGGRALFEPKTFEAFRRRKLRGYLGAVSQVDHAVGLMLDFLTSSGLAENTIVVYGADHGEYACEHGILEKAPGICHDAVTRVPYIWWAPGRFRVGHAVEAIVETVDTPVTLASLAGLDAMETADGRDISPLLMGEKGDPGRPGVTEFPWSRSFRKGNFRLVWYAKDKFANEYPAGFGELYDLKNDPWEMRNLYFDPAYRSTVEELRGDLLDWLVRTTRPATVLQVSRNLGPGAGGRRVLRHRNWIDSDGKFSPDAILSNAQGNYV